MKESAFNKKVIELCGNDTMEILDYLKKFKKQIITQYDEDDVNHEHRWMPFDPAKSYNSLESGVYLTIRCGLGGIYQTYNIWDAKEKKWLIQIADGSFTIMFKDIEPYMN